MILHVAAERLNSGHLLLCLFVFVLSLSLSLSLCFEDEMVRYRHARCSSENDLDPFVDELYFPAARAIIISLVSYSGTQRDV